MSCPACKTHVLVQITMKVSDEDVTFRSCSSCDLRWWSGEHGPVALPSVLERVAAADPGRRPLTQGAAG